MDNHKALQLYIKDAMLQYADKFHLNDKKKYGHNLDLFYYDTYENEERPVKLIKKSIFDYMIEYSDFEIIDFYNKLPIIQFIKKEKKEIIKEIKEIFKDCYTEEEELSDDSKNSHKYCVKVFSYIKENNCLNCQEETYIFNLNSIFVFADIFEITKAFYNGKVNIYHDKKEKYRINVRLCLSKNELDLVKLVKEKLDDK